MRDKYGALIGIAFILSVSVLFVAFISFFAKEIKSICEQKKTLRDFEKA